MQITIWSDFVCPFCYIGVTNLEQALEKSGYDLDTIEIEYKSFQLEPGAQYEAGKSYLQAMTERKQTTEKQMQEMIDQITTMAKSVGLKYNFDDMKLTDTFTAHRLFQYSKEQGKGYEYFDELYQAFFLNGQLISDHDFLKKVSEKIGLDEARVHEILNTEEEYAKEVVLDIQQASQVGAQGVPFFVFDNKYGVSGAQPVAIFEEILKKIEQDFKEEE